MDDNSVEPDSLSVELESPPIPGSNKKYQKVKKALKTTFDRVKTSFDLSVYGFDVGSDVTNGVGFLRRCHTAWGSLTLGLIFLPALTAVWGVILGFYGRAVSEKTKSKIILFALLFLFPLLVVLSLGTFVAALVTLFMILAVVGTHLYLIWDTEAVDQRKEIPYIGIPTIILGPALKLWEAFFESAPQAILGWYILAMDGPSQDHLVGTLNSGHIQIFGAIISLFSLVKASCDFHLIQLRGFKAMSGFIESMKASMFFTYHVILRMIAYTCMLAFLRLYSILPFTIILLFNACSAWFCLMDSQWMGAGGGSDDDGDIALSTVTTALLSVFTPVMVMGDTHYAYMKKQTNTKEEKIDLKSRHRQWKEETLKKWQIFNILTTNSIIMLTLVSIFCVLSSSLPEVSPMFQHISRSNTSGVCVTYCPHNTSSHFSNETISKRNASCDQMFLTADTFTNILFPILMVLGILTLVESNLMAVGLWTPNKFLYPNYEVNILCVKYEHINSYSINYRRRWEKRGI